MAAKQNETTPSSSAWFDEATQTPIIENHVRRLDSFLAAMADGDVNEKELQAQEARLVKLMKEVEPQLTPALHDKVTQLLCELTAYDIMHTFHIVQEAKPKAAFRG
jgi:hypothetical protein